MPAPRARCAGLARPSHHQLEHFDFGAGLAAQLTAVDLVGQRHLQGPPAGAAGMPWWQPPARARATRE